MNSTQRREQILVILKNSGGNVTASILAEKLQVSRQIIVGDIALLRAVGTDILSTPKGYILNSSEPSKDYLFKIACFHHDDLTKEEIYAVVDNGGKLIDVIIEHAIYGQLVGQLNISSRYDAQCFFEKAKEEGVCLLSALTDGIHLHSISCKDEKNALRIKEALKKIGVLYCQ